MVKIRLMRRGATKRPAYRVVVADSRSPRDGRFIENIGRYQPLADPSVIEIDEERALYWLSRGAQPTEQVQNLLVKLGVWEKFRPGSKAGPKPGERKAAES
ncbi:MAG: 30S ribosomal protein S16 [Actinobacteria bacterium]|nr:MAG: 30S ribosomal protein S16 [Actinomycetota bacterium]